jgi:hypothetical protein
MSTPAKRIMDALTAHMAAQQVFMYASDNNKHAALEGIEHAERRLDEVEALYPGLFDRIFCGGE